MEVQQIDQVDEIIKQAGIQEPAVVENANAADDADVAVVETPAKEDTILDAESSSHVDHNTFNEEENKSIAEVSDDEEKVVSVASSPPPSSTPSSPQPKADSEVRGGSTTSSSTPTTTTTQSSPPPPPPVVELTSSNFLSILSLTPALLIDVYAPWCGPCKALTPALEEMANKSNGAFVLGKINADNEGVLARVLGVTGYPTIFGVREGRVVNTIVGMPKGEEEMRKFMMKFITGGESEMGMEEIGDAMLRAASGGAFSFGDRERTTEMVKKILDDVKEDKENVQAVGVAARLVENVAGKPREGKYRFINLSNPRISSAFTAVPSLKGIVKVAGFKKTSGGYRMEGSVPDVARCACVAEACRGWCRQAELKVSEGIRKEREKREVEEAKRIAEGERVGREREEEERKEERERERERMEGKCKVKWRREGKKKISSTVVDETGTLTEFLEEIECKDARAVVSAGKGVTVGEGEFGRTWRDVGLTGNVNVVVRVGGGEEEEGGGEGKSKLAERAKMNKKKRGSHTMQSSGIYGRDDGRKGNLVDGGGGTVYEVTDEDEVEEDIGEGREEGGEEEEEGGEEEEEEEDEGEEEEEDEGEGEEEDE
ncbi:hypothetical protein TrCOL_g11467 [Triparma columacea]|uniref:Thioredoxin domain-containing protein n=1 Tax=Triparma columacea TaxID=722753 RepID=A0A9W7G558_9STRA|nr:hypothetical protein TrCOL_g11467 [Triparma columacea]